MSEDETVKSRAEELITDRELDSIEQAACFGDYGRDSGDEIARCVEEVRRLRAELDRQIQLAAALLRENVRMRPVYEAAKAWRVEWRRRRKIDERRSPDPMYMFITDEVQALLDAIDDFNAKEPR